MIYIVGSGPAGIATAVTLVNAGLSVTLLDGGLTLAPEKTEKLQQLKTQDKSAWDQSFISSFKENLVSDQKGLQKKLAYGSDYPYAEVETHIPMRAHSIGQLTPTLAQGGFSTVWGSAVLPFSKKDIAAWPIPHEELEKHFRSVLEFLPLTAERDALEDHFPLYTDSYQSLKRSAQAEKILFAANRAEEQLREAKIVHGAPRLAVGGDACVYCGLCLFGCPKSIIYSTQSTLNELFAHKNFNYRPNCILERVQESEGEVVLDTFDRISREKLVFRGEAVFLGAGVLATAKILFESFPNSMPERELLVSEYFLLPLLHAQKTAGVETEELHALSQMFIECFDPEISAHSIHMQLYTYSELYKNALSRMFRALGPARGLLSGAVLSRLLAIQGYLHSDDSSRIRLRYENSQLLLDGEINPRAKSVIRKAARKLYRHRKNLGFTPILPMLQVGLPGEGRHVGGSFPMKIAPGIGETDVAGRLYGNKNIYLVDASVFPSVPASTITFSAMANAQRIASLYAGKRAS